MSDWEQGVHTGLQVERDGHVAIVTLSNPPANTWTVHSLAALRDLVRALDADRSIHALVITGEGEKFFSAGADLKQFADGDKANAREAARRFGEAFEALSAFRGVSIAAINGYAMGRAGVRIGLRSTHRRAASTSCVARSQCWSAAMCRRYPESAARGRRRLGQAHDPAR